MTISVINTTMLPRQEVQDKIRAVNRQLQEDFKRYWHVDVQLRLEGWTGETLDPSRPLKLPQPRPTPPKRPGRWRKSRACCPTW